MHLLQHTFFWIFFGFGFYEEKKEKIEKSKKSGPEEAKNYIGVEVEGEKKWKKKRVRERTRLLSKAEK